MSNASDRNKKLEIIQKQSLDILTEVASFCEKNGLRYILYCGTLLGCIRHQGFIPWDDDADIAMPLRDYREFIRRFPLEHKENYTLSDINSCQGFAYHLPYAKVYRNGTTCAPIGELNYPSHHGFSIDIYPIIGSYDHRLAKKLQPTVLRFVQALLQASYPVEHKKQSESVFKLLRRIPYPLRRALAILLLKWAMADPEKHKYVGTIDAAPFRGKYRYETLMETMNASFEGKEFPIPQDYDKALSAMYGNYRKLPPEKERYPHHLGEEMIVDDQIDYMEYRKEYYGR